MILTVTRRWAISRKTEWPWPDLLMCAMILVKAFTLSCSVSNLGQRRNSGQLVKHMGLYSGLLKALEGGHLSAQGSQC